MKAQYTILTNAGKHLTVSGKDAKEVRRKLSNVKIITIKRKDVKHG